MSFSQGNTKGGTVTLHMVSSLDGFIAKHDNTVSWMDTPGSVYEPGISISEEEIATFLKSIDCYVLGFRTYEHALHLGWPYGRYPRRCGNHQKMAAGEHKEEHRVLFRRSQNLSRRQTRAQISKHLAGRRRHVVPALSRARLDRRNQANDRSSPVRRRTPPVRRFLEGEEVEFEERDRLQERLRRTFVLRPDGVKAMRRLTKLSSTDGSDAVPSSAQPNELDRQDEPVA